MHTPTNGTARVLLDGLLRVAGPVALALVMFLLGLGVSAERRIDSLEQGQAATNANRFTVQDGVALRAEVSGHATRAEVSQLQQEIRDELREIRRLIAER